MTSLILGTDDVCQQVSHRSICWKSRI